MPDESVFAEDEKIVSEAERRGMTRMALPLIADVVEAAEQANAAMYQRAELPHEQPTRPDEAREWRQVIVEDIDSLVERVRDALLIAGTLPDSKENIAALAALTELAERVKAAERERDLAKQREKQADADFDLVTGRLYGTERQLKETIAQRDELQRRLREAGLE